MYNKYTFKFSSYAKHCHMIMIILPMGALESKRLRLNTYFDPHLNIRATLMQMSRSLRWFSRIKQRVKNALLDRKEGRDSDWSAIFLKAAVT